MIQDLGTGAVLANQFQISLNYFRAQQVNKIITILGFQQMLFNRLDIRPVKHFDAYSLQSFSVARHIQKIIFRNKRYLEAHFTQQQERIESQY
ncbi:hypothetical protein D3C71_1713990 [compost metagenome]